MSSRRRLVSPSPSPSDDSPSPSPIASGSGQHQRRSKTREVRISTGGGSSGHVKASSSSSRTRRPTPVVRRHGGQQADDYESDSDQMGTDSNGEDNSNKRRQISITTKTNGGGRSSSHRQMTLASCSSATRPAPNGVPLSWYERMMPEFLLNMTAPLTGYENRLELMSDEISGREYEILERDRLRRNKRVRRRLALVVLVASLASAFFIYRGRMPGGRRPPGVRGAINTMAHRLEDGLSKTIHDTMGN